MPGASGPKYSLYVSYDTQWNFRNQEQKQFLVFVPLDPHLRPLKAPLAYALANSNCSLGAALGQQGAKTFPSEFT
jgi:hypothetical protein